MSLDLPLEEHTLPNGLRVVVQPDRTAPVVAVNLWVRVGSGHEEPGRTGLAHLFEHLMFQGSPRVAKGEHFSRLMDVGGSANATTSLDRTNYFEALPAGALDLALWLESDRHLFLREALDQGTLDNQRDVVVEEKRQRYDNQPYGDAFHRMQQALFPADHPYHHSTIGSMDDLAAATLEDAHAFHARHYRPDNTVLTLVGDVEPEHALARVEHWFGEWARPEEPLLPAPHAPLLPLEGTAPRHHRVPDAVPSERVHVAFRAPGELDADHLPLAVGMDVLAGLASSRLTQRLLRTEESVHGVSGHVMGNAAGVSPGFVIADVADGHTAEEVADAIVEELVRVGRDGVGADDLAAVQADTERSWLSALAHHDQRADVLGQFATVHGRPHAAWEWLDGVRAVTEEDVRRAAATWWQPGAFEVITYTPQEDA
ncbi:Predicted Zn-dependent peptidase [Kytococcus aerolatus]|uniref:Predicted Zn-dependent peptidase n=1 Tax=Kytococcus aerolatus TaxID=592308 RepID=A0A212T7V2_9MICO|nr:pitrilysin family protein [Kytococcus aerolatus]SNC61896.1 Predicted Zn-dependent peptidase [Kytococcus aerolatus]